MVELGADPEGDPFCRPNPHGQERGKLRQLVIGLDAKHRKILETFYPPLSINLDFRTQTQICLADFFYSRTKSPF